jgi:hypothetical protein
MILLWINATAGSELVSITAGLIPQPAVSFIILQIYIVHTMYI